MIIEVKQPMFIIDINNPVNVFYQYNENEINDNCKYIIVQIFAQGFPPIEKNQILYKYNNNRGYIYTIPPTKESKTILFKDIKIGDQIYFLFNFGRIPYKFYNRKVLSIDDNEFYTFTYFEDDVNHHHYSWNAEVDESIKTLSLYQTDLSKYKTETVLGYNTLSLCYSDVNKLFEDVEIMKKQYEDEIDGANILFNDVLNCIKTEMFTI